MSVIALATVANAASFKWYSECKLWNPATNSYATDEPTGGTICLCLVVTDADTGATSYKFLQDSILVQSGYTSEIGKVKSVGTNNRYTIPTGTLKDGDILTVLFWDREDKFSHLYYVDENGQPTSKIVDDTYVVSEGRQLHDGSAGADCGSASAPRPCGPCASPTSRIVHVNDTNGAHPLPCMMVAIPIRSKHISFYQLL